MERFNELTQINSQAFDEGHYNTAYHALAAALHCAQDENDREKALLVARTARTQGEWIDAHALEYEHSSSSAKGRGFQEDGIYVMLGRQAKSMAELIRLRESNPA